MLMAGMTLFEFLEKISAEEFPLKLSYNGYGGVVVEIDAFFEKWKVTFGKNGFWDYEKFVEVDEGPEASEDISRLETLFDRPAETWRKAAEDLSIRFISPYRFTHNGQQYSVTGLLPDFGGGQRVLITSRKDLEFDCAVAYMTGHYYRTGLYPRHYDRYDRDHIIGTLNDWGWCGEGDPPSWFKGEIIRPASETK